MPEKEQRGFGYFIARAELAARMRDCISVLVKCTSSIEMPSTLAGPDSILAKKPRLPVFTHLADKERMGTNPAVPR